MLLWIAALFCLLLTTLAVGVTLYMFMQYSSPEPSLIEIRLKTFKELGKRESSYGKDEEKDITALFKGSLYSSKKWESFLEKYSFVGWLKQMLVQAGQTTPIDQYLIKTVFIPVIMTFVLGLVLGMPFIILLGPLLSGGMIGLLVFQRNKRLEKMTEQLPDALSIMTSALRAGHSFQSALALMVNEMQDPIAGELAQVVNDMNLGLSLKESFAKLLDNISHLPDYHMLATAVLIQRETGGNLAEVLEGLSVTIRDRFKLKRQINALTGQAQATGFILGMAPLVMLILLTLFFYSYVEPLYTTTIGNIAIGVAVVLQIIGFFFIKKILTVEF